MGYRSRVAIAIRQDAVAEFEAACPVAVAELFNAPYRIKCDKAGTAQLYVVDSVKWYDDDPDFQEVAEIVRWMRDNDDELFRFVRAGEDSGDMEDRGYLVCPVHVYEGAPYLELPLPLDDSAPAKS